MINLIKKRTEKNMLSERQWQILAVGDNKCHYVWGIK